MLSLSVILITKNEGRNLEDCLASLSEIAQEIIIVDSTSDDQTLDIAKKYGAIISIPNDWPGFGPQKNRALALASKDWVLSLDADERLTKELRSEIKIVLSRPEAHCYSIPRSSWYCGRFMKHSGWSPDYVDRLFKRGTARFSDNLVHERLIPEGRVKKLKSPMLHYSFMNFSQVLQKVDRYSTDSANQAFTKNKKSSLSKAVLHGFWTFIRIYFLKLGFLDGPQGLALAIKCRRQLLSLFKDLANARKKFIMIISLIVATYNRPDALNLVLQSLENQTDKKFEVIIADDGSEDDTRCLINEFKSNSSLSITHAWHEDLGFRLVAVRNLATKQSDGDYLIFLDGDCAVQPDFIARHRVLAEPNHMVTGGRILLDEKLTNHLLKIGKWDFESFKRNLLIYRLSGQINKILAFYIKLGNFSWRNYPDFVWRRIKGCNLACWKKDIV
ncbi:MAG: glycosyltransferase, partial [Proteobacteria bacterium]|nr:glycosyltransferase [Pseudomonadota bacterium]